VCVFAHVFDSSDSKERARGERPTDKRAAPNANAIADASARRCAVPRWYRHAGANAGASTDVTDASANLKRR